MIIPIGIQCTNATFKQSFEKTHTLPFDWMFATPSFVFEMLELLLEKNINIDVLVKNHFFYCEKRANLNGTEHYYTCDNGFALFNTKYNVIFPHDENNNDSINKYIRRFERLISKFRNNYKMILFDAIQEEEISLLDENIRLIKLNKCNSWIDLVPQMIKHKFY
jgi:hypothetical protein